MAVTFALLPAGSAFAATNHNILYNPNRSLGWCADGTGYPIFVSAGCAGETWTFTSETKFDGYAAYEITNGGLCATVAESNGVHYSQNQVVLEGCVGASNQLFVNPANPGTLDSDWAGYYYGCGALGGPTVYNAAFGYNPAEDVSVNPCGSGTTWDIPLSS